MKLSFFQGAGEEASTPAGHFLLWILNILKK